MHSRGCGAGSASIERYAGGRDSDATKAEARLKPSLTSARSPPQRPSEDRLKPERKGRGGARLAGLTVPPCNLYVVTGAMRRGLAVPRRLGAAARFAAQQALRARRGWAGAPPGVSRGICRPAIHCRLGDHRHGAGALRRPSWRRAAWRCLEAQCWRVTRRGAAGRALGRAGPRRRVVGPVAAQCL